MAIGTLLGICAFAKKLMSPSFATQVKLGIAKKSFFETCKTMPQIIENLFIFLQSEKVLFIDHVFIHIMFLSIHQIHYKKKSRNIQMIGNIDPGYGYTLFFQKNYSSFRFMI